MFNILFSLYYKKGGRFNSGYESALNFILQSIEVIDWCSVTCGSVIDMKVDALVVVLPIIYFKIG